MNALNASDAMNAMFDETLSSFDRLFGCKGIPKTPSVYELESADMDARAAHVAKVAPQLARIYAAHPVHIVKAFGYVDLDDCHALRVALAGTDDAEIGRLLRAAMQPHFQQQAEDTAEDESYVLFPERDL